MKSADTLRQPSPSRRWWWQLRRGVVRGGFFAALWWIFTTGDTNSWIVGIPIVTLATAISLALLPAYHWRWCSTSGLRFMWFFLYRSFLGGVDVAWRAFHPRLPLTPSVVDYPLRLTDTTTQVFLSLIVSLLPGTLSTVLDQDHLLVHVLSGTPDSVQAELHTLEHHVADLFGVDLASSTATLE